MIVSMTGQGCKWQCSTIIVIFSKNEMMIMMMMMMLSGHCFHHFMILDVP